MCAIVDMRDADELSTRDGVIGFSLGFVSCLRSESAACTREDSINVLFLQQFQEIISLLKKPTVEMIYFYQYCMQVMRLSKFLIT